MNSEKLKSVYEKSKNWIKNKSKEHFINSTALLTESTPLFALYEKGIAKMSDEVSINARIFATGLTYFGGMGYFYSKGRDFYRKKLNVTDKTNEGVQFISDAGYTGLFNALAGPAIYFACGSRDLKEIAIGTGCAICLGIANGPLMGYAVDTFRDLTGLNECNRKSYPKIIKKQPSKIKKAIAVGLVLASLGATKQVYDRFPDYENRNLNQTTQTTNQTIEQVVDSNPPKIINAETLEEFKQ
jgi:hypothetical protein